VNVADKRRAERFIGAIPIVLKQGTGLTRDFSTDGVYFETDQALSVGEELDFIMHLNHADPAEQLRLKCRGKVLRLEPGSGKIGVAVAVDSHMLRGTMELA
jgi:PilZ domain